MRYVTLLLLFCTVSIGAAQTIDKNLQISKLSDNTYLYTAWADVGTWGRVGSNGLIVVDGSSAFLFDTPMHEEHTVQLVEWVESNLKVKIVGFVAGHWHSDCVGGLDFLNRRGVASYSNRLTNDILKESGAVQTKFSFVDSVTLKLNNVNIECYYLGGGHAVDNIVMWIPSEGVLFGGCMVKDVASTSLGNTQDAAPLSEWQSTVEAVYAKFTEAKIVVPGHGATGGLELLEHTKELLVKNQKL